MLLSAIVEYNSPFNYEQRKEHLKFMKNEDFESWFFLRCELFIDGIYRTILPALVTYTDLENTRNSGLFDKKGTEIKVGDTIKIHGDTIAEITFDQRLKHSYKDTKGNIFVDCIECARGINGKDKYNLCSCGQKHKKPGHGCFNGYFLHQDFVRNAISTCPECGHENYNEFDADCSMKCGVCSLDYDDDDLMDAHYEKWKRVPRPASKEDDKL